MARQRARRVEHLHQPLERKLLVAVGRQVARRAPARSARAGSGPPSVSVRSTSVLTKNPTRSSSAASVRPAIGLPIGMSKPAPSRVSSAASASLQHHEQARTALARQPQQARGEAPPTAPPQRCPRHGSPPQAAPGRAADRKLLRKLGQRLRQNESWRASALAGSLSVPSSRMLPQRIVGILHRQRRPLRRRPRAARRIGARQVAHQRRKRPAVPGNVMQQQQQHMLARSPSA